MNETKFDELYIILSAVAMFFFTMSKRRDLSSDLQT